MSNLEFSKANRTKVINSFPTKETGKEGDIIISKIKGKGYFLCTKVGNAWYSSNKLNELKRLTSPKLKELEVDSLKVNNLRIKKQPVNGEISLSKGNLTLDVEGDIELNADGGDITFKDDTAALATINGTGLTINNIGADSAGDNYLVEVSGLVKKRTPAEVRSDIGAGTSSVAALNDLSDVTYSGGDLTISSLDTIISGALLIDSSGDITLDAAGAQIEIDNAGTTFGTIDTASAGRLKLIGATNYTVEVNSLGTGDIIISSADNITIDATDHLTMDSDGTFIMKKDGTEFSATNSAYAGMILGYTRIQDNDTDPGDDYVTINSSAMTVLQTVAGTDLSIQFIVPPSGNVEIECRFWVTASSDGAKFSLSTAGTGSSYAELGEAHTYDADYTFFIDESDHYVVSVVFAVTGLTAGTDTTYYLAGLASGASTYIRHGRHRTTGTHSPPIILKAIALPATIVTGE